MSLYARTASFSLSAGVTASVAVVSGINELSELFWATVGVIVLCTFTSWLGFGLAKIQDREPSVLYSGALGVLFVCIPISLGTLMSAGFLHVAGLGLAFLWFFFATPIFVYVGSLFSKRMSSIANPLLNTDAQQEPPRAG